MVFSKTWPPTASWPGKRTTRGWLSLGRVARRTSTLLRALTVGLLAPLLLRARPELLAKLLEPRRPTRVRDDRLIAETLELTDTALARGRPLIRTGCLTRGVTRYRMLRRAGAEIALCFGVGSIDGNVEAHCWLDEAGTPILEPADVQQFHEMFRICRPGVVVDAT